MTTIRFFKNSALRPASLLALLCVLGLSLPGCKNRRAGNGDAPVGNPPIAIVEVPASGAASSSRTAGLTINNTQYYQLRLRGRGQAVRRTGSIPGFNYVMHLRRDSAIWLSAGAFGIEGIRFLATREGVVLVNRLERKYFRATYPELSERLGMQLSLSVVEDMLLGNLSQELITDSIPQGADVDVTRAVKADMGNFLLNYFRRAQDAKVTRIEALDAQRALQAQATFDDFRSVTAGNANGILPFAVLVELRKGPLTSLELRHSDVQLNAVDLAFKLEVPRDYEPMR